MSSLQDQLLKAGLIDNKKAKQAQKDQRKQTKMQHKSKEVLESEAKLAAQQAREEKLEKDRRLNAERDAQAQKKAIIAQIKQLIEINKQSRGGGDIAYNFTADGKVKKILVSAAIQKCLVNGQLAIAKSGEGFELVPAKIANKIIERDASFIVSQAAEAKNIPVEDDPYADFVIPDDLMW